MNRSISHQDASGAAGMPLGIFRDGVLVATAPKSDPHGTDTLADLVAKHGPAARFEALIVCLNHPDTAAVDCIVCAPLDEE